MVRTQKKRKTWTKVKRWESSMEKERRKVRRKNVLRPYERAETE